MYRAGFPSLNGDFVPLSWYYEQLSNFTVKILGIDIYQHTVTCVCQECNIKKEIKNTGVINDKLVEFCKDHRHAPRINGQESNQK